ncbi:MAG: translation initiation factor IF-3 [Candidatus Saccharimonadales bacterium]
MDASGNQIGIVSKSEALAMANEQGLDLVEVSPNAKPPVAKIVDWGKYNYQRTKQLQKNRSHSKAQELKQMRLGLKISDHDLGVKLRKVSGFLDEGHKVKIIIFYRGRENAHRELGYNLADRVVAELGDSVVVDQVPQLAGKQLIFTVRKV